MNKIIMKNNNGKNCLNSFGNDYYDIKDSPQNIFLEKVIVKSLHAPDEWHRTPTIVRSGDAWSSVEKFVSDFKNVGCLSLLEDALNNVDFQQAGIEDIRGKIIDSDPDHIFVFLITLPNGKRECMYVGLDTYKLR